MFEYFRGIRNGFLTSVCLFVWIEEEEDDDDELGRLKFVKKFLQFCY